MATWLQGSVVENNQWCTDLYSLKISVDPIKFKAGQFASIGMEENNEILARPYSLVNTPHDPILEIHFNTVIEGHLSPRLARLGKGDVVHVSDRTGGLLTIDEVPDVPNLWLLATGTGIGPFLSILKTDEPWKRFKNIVLCYSVMTHEKLAYQTDIEKFQSDYPEQFRFIPFITREKVAGTISSRITTSIENGELEKQAALQLSSDSNHFMLCGNSTMISEVTTLLESRGLRRHKRREPGHIAIEKYY
ncbi:MAG: ferredoxin--NADP reductase [Gammaproteobacteria bacterium]|nr:ferredoxin--NADP reductase [Gammaproteobacteria bacterium]